MDSGGAITYRTSCWLLAITLPISPLPSQPPKRHVSHASRRVGRVLSIPGVLLPRELATGSCLCRSLYRHRGCYPLEDILAMLAAM